MKKLAIIVGHNEKSQGAMAGSPISLSEFRYNTKLAKIMSEIGGQYGFEVGVFFRPPIKSYTQQIKRVYAQVDQWGADFSMELHFNRFDKKSAYGTETWSSGTGRSLKMAQAVQEELVKLFERDGRGDRGVKILSRKARGGLSVWQGKAPAILIEPFFGSNAADCKMVADLGQRIVAAALLRGVAKSIGQMPRSKVTQSTTYRTGKATIAGGGVATAIALVGTVSEAAPGVRTILDLVKDYPLFFIGAVGLAGLAIGAIVMSGYYRAWKKTK